MKTIDLILVGPDEHFKCEGCGDGGRFLFPIRQTTEDILKPDVLLCRTCIGRAEALAVDQYCYKKFGRKVVPVPDPLERTLKVLNENSTYGKPLPVDKDGEIIPEKKPCPVCEGAGHLVTPINPLKSVGQKCWYCNGTGQDIEL